MAQASGRVSLVSDYRFRGESLADGHAEPQLAVDFDSAGGWYAGGFASKVALYRDTVNNQITGYGGYAHRMESGIALEAGAVETAFPGASRFSYAEWYAGLTGRNLGARIYFSPHYFGRERTIYAELNGSYPLGERLHFIGHFGVLRVLSDGHSGNASAMQSDSRIGIDAAIGDWHIQLERVAVEKKRESYFYYQTRSSPGVVLTVSYSF